MESLYQSIKDIILSARATTYRAVNFTMVQSYWHIGQQIVEVEQQGATRAKYGESLLATLSERLTRDFGKGFDERELRKMRQFYLSFSIRDSLRPELSWTHYPVENEQARMWYMNEAANENWSSRQLARQVAVLYYERLLSSATPAAVKKEAAKLLGESVAEEFIRNPYILNFIGIKEDASYFEKDIEHGLIDNMQSFLLDKWIVMCVCTKKNLLYLPTEEELKREIEKERNVIESLKEEG